MPKAVHRTKPIPKAASGTWSKPVGSVSQFLALIEAEKQSEVGHENKADFIFRGQQRDQPLIPRIGRLIPKGDLANIEKLMMNEFARQMPLFSEVTPHDEWDMLALAQHHRLATRLLDWTYNALAALWFCVEKGPARLPIGDATNGVVWLFKTRPDDFLKSHRGSPFHQERTRIFRPRFISRRIMAQAGVFTCHRLHGTHQFVPLERNRNYKQRLMKLEIAAPSFSEIREQLGAAGVSSLSLFSDLDGLTAFLEDRYFHDPHELRRPMPPARKSIKFVSPADVASRS